MKDSRSASQIQFGYLPEQTVDVRGGVWKVDYWNDPIREHAIDLRTLRDELIRAVAPWQAAGKDNGFTAALRADAQLELRKLNRSRGVTLRPFPRTWMCRRCNRLHRQKEGRCPCGATTARSQLPFVGYHDCGRLKEPYFPPCPAHRQVAIRYPGTASAREIEFYCPVCNARIRKGLADNIPCECGDGAMTYTVHRAASVYTPRSIVIVNPPSTHRIEELGAVGGAARALEWVLGGMVERNATDIGATAESLRRQLQAAGLSPTLIERTVADAQRDGTLRGEPEPLPLTESQSAIALREAVLMALAAADSRFTLDDLQASVPAVSDAGIRYRESYGAAIKSAGLGAVELFDKFPVMVGQYAYTRGAPGPGQSTLRPFRSRAGVFTVYGEVAETEALLFMLSASRVWEWLRRLELISGEHPENERACRSALLQACDFPGWQGGGNAAGQRLVVLIHSLAHRAIRLLAVHAGIERNSLSELLVPSHLGFYLYASARGDFVLGGLQAVFESELDTFLKSLLHDEHRCALDPGCERGGAACTACLHIGEPSCRMYNAQLSRTTLFGPEGYLR